MALLKLAAEDHHWSSEGLDPLEALQSWQRLASESLTPLHIDIPDESGFSARLSDRGVGPLRLVTLDAPSQRVLHRGEDRAWRAEPVFQLCYFSRMPTPVTGSVGSRAVTLSEGQFVLLDNSQPYQMSMGAGHRAVVLVMPNDWVERCLSDPSRAAGKPLDATSPWGLPLGSYLQAMAEQLEEACLPRSVLADQLSGLIPLAVGEQPPTTTRHKTKLARRVIRAIEERYNDPDLTPERLATELGISKRYLHALLAEAETTFLAVLGRARLQRASEMLIDHRLRREQIGEIAWRCGYLDPGYFARVFRRRYGMGPREWRNAHA